MDSLWDYPDFDEHELVHFVTDRKTGLRAVIAVHSTHLGPGAGGTRLWHYADEDLAITDALRLSRGMSYKNAMAGLPLGGGKAVVLANDAARTKTPEMLAAFGRAVNNLSGRYVTAEDVGMNVADMVASLRELGLPRDYWDTYRSRIAAVGADQALAAARRYVDPDKTLVVLVGEAPRIEPIAARWGPVTVVAAEDGHVVRTVPAAAN